MKHNYLVTDINDIPRIVKEAFYIAQTGRPGPVVIDVPKNIQQAKAQPVFPREIKRLRGYDPDKRASDLELNEIIGLIEKSERPVLYVGGGIITGNASAELLKFAEAANIPVTTTIMGCGAFPETHTPLSLRWLGMHGSAYANWAVSGRIAAPRDNPSEPPRKLAHGADLLLAFGVRFDDRVTGKPGGENSARQGRSSILTLTRRRLNKNKPANLPIVSDVKYALDAVERDGQRAADRRGTSAHGTSRSPGGSGEGAVRLSPDRGSGAVAAHAWTI